MKKHIASAVSGFALLFLVVATPPLTAADPPSAAVKPPGSVKGVDITNTQGMGLKLGSKFAAWGGTLNLTQADSFMQSNGQCAFNAEYQMVNLGTNPTTHTFGNNLKTGKPPSVPYNVVSHQTNLSLKPGETKTINTQLYLHPGTGILSLWLDDDGAPPNHEVVETIETNNSFRLSYTLDATCKPQGGDGKPNLVIRSFEMKPTGKCAPNEPVYIAHVVLANIGTAPAAPDPSFAMVQAMSVDRPGWGNGMMLTAPLAAGASTTFDIPVYYLMDDPPYMVSAPHKFKGIADPGKKVNESNEGDNESAPIAVPIPVGCKLLAPPIKK